ncbi:MAG: zinc ribbon domain-containing protein [Candidatus Lokiarchaeota archaeon]|nr:zinc ribbon domain-containing protein [Candidatus Lokiarchaeota archaeon]
MYCPKCNAELKSPSQKFCHKCGASLEKKNSSVDNTIISSSGQVVLQKTEKIPTYKKPEPPSKPIEPLVITKQTKKFEFDKYTIKTFTFGVTSFFFAILAFILVTPILQFHYPYRYYFSPIENMTVLIITINIHVAGIILAITGKGQSNKAKTSDSAKITGLVFSNLAEVLNSIGIAVATFALLIFPLAFSWELYLIV